MALASIPMPKKVEIVFAVDAMQTFMMGSGIEVLKRLRVPGRTQQISVIVVSSEQSLKPYLILLNIKMPGGILLQIPWRGKLRRKVISTVSNSVFSETLVLLYYSPAPSDCLTLVGRDF